MPVAAIVPVQPSPLVPPDAVQVEPAVLVHVRVIGAPAVTLAALELKLTAMPPVPDSDTI